MKKKYFFPVALFLFIVFPGFSRSELLFHIPPEIKYLLPPDVTRQWGKRVTVKSPWKSLSRDRQRLAPGYPWILLTEEVRARLSESVYLQHLKVLTGLTPDKLLHLRGKWAVLVSDDKLEDGESFPGGRGYFRPCLVVESVKTVSPEGGKKKALSETDRAELRRAVQTEKLKAARDPERASSARKKLARLYLQAGEYEKAIHEYRFEMIVNPDKASSYRRKIAEIYELMGEPELARVEYELADLTRPESDSRRYRQRLDKWEEEENYGPLLQEYRFLLQTDPASRPKYLKKIARLFALIGDEENSRDFWQQLIELYREQIEGNSDRAFDYHLRIADIYREMGEVAAAVREYARAKEAAPKMEALVLIEEADLYREKGESEKAWELYLRAEGLEGADLISLRTEMARFLGRQGRSEEAIAYLEKAAAAGEKEGARARLKLARLLVREGKTEEALAAYREAMPDLGEGYQSRIWEQMGNILEELSRPEEARQAYQKSITALKAELGDYVPGERQLQHLAELEEKSGRPEEALKYYRELLVVLSDRRGEEPREADRYYRKLEEVYRKMARYEDAAELCREWIRREPDNPSPYSLLSRLYRDYLEDEDLAGAWREKSRSLRKKHREK